MDSKSIGWIVIIVVLLFVLFVAYEVGKIVLFRSRIRSINTATKSGKVPAMLSVLYDLRGVKREADDEDIDDTVILLSAAMQGMCDILGVDNESYPSLESQSIRPTPNRVFKTIPLSESIKYLDSLNLGDELRWLRTVVQAMYNLSPGRVEVDGGGDAGSSRYIKFEYSHKSVILYISVE